MYYILLSDDGDDDIDDDDGGGSGGGDDFDDDCMEFFRCASRIVAETWYVSIIFPYFPSIHFVLNVVLGIETTKT